MKVEKPTNRRNFIKSGTLTLAGIFCFSSGLKEALAMAKESGKPLLTEQALNELFRQKYSSKQIKVLAKEISKDIVGWVSKEFTLTSIQERAVKSIPQAHWAEVKKVLKEVEQHGVTLRVTISQTETKDDKVFQSVSTPFGCKGKVKVTAEGEVGPVKVNASASAETT